MEVKRLALSADLQMAYTDIGHGTLTLLFIHGLGSDRHCWVKNWMGLQEHFRCIAVDLPGYGESTQGNYPFSMSFFAQCIAAFIEKLQLDTVVLVGHSMGAQIAIHTILKHPQVAKKLILIAPAGFETFSPQERAWFAQLYKPELLQMVPLDQFIRNMDQNFFIQGPDIQPLRDERLRIFRSPDYSQYTTMISMNIMSMLDEPVYDRLGKLDLPVLILFGEQDRMIPNPLLHPQLNTYQVARTGQQKISHSQLHMIPQAGHFVQWEQSSQVNHSIIRFLTS